MGWIPDSLGFTVEELTRKGVPTVEACLIVWPSVDDAVVAEYLRSQRTQSEADVARVEASHDAQRCQFAQPVHHEFGEARH